jgi:hypothetical protein
VLALVLGPSSLALPHSPLPAASAPVWHHILNSIEYVLQITHTSDVGFTGGQGTAHWQGFAALSIRIPASRMRAKGFFAPIDGLVNVPSFIPKAALLSLTPLVVAPYSLL